MIFEIVNEGADKLGTLTDDEGGWKVFAVWAVAGGGFVLTLGAEVEWVGNYVIFTTVA